MVTQLRIKRVFFDQILCGKKTVEYRSLVPYYKKIFDKNPKIIIFHYQSNARLFCYVENIEIVNCVERYKKSEYLYTEQIYAISIKPLLNLNEHGNYFLSVI